MCAPAGKTQTINHFKVVSGSSGPWYLVDLPGYGFAKAPGAPKTRGPERSQTTPGRLRKELALWSQASKVG